jgi:hypothetical protein
MELWMWTNLASEYRALCGQLCGAVLYRSDQYFSLVDGRSVCNCGFCKWDFVDACWAFCSYVGNVYCCILFICWQSVLLYIVHFRCFKSQFCNICMKKCMFLKFFVKYFVVLYVIIKNYIPSTHLICNRPASWFSGQSFWLLIMRSRVWFPVLPWGFFLEGEDSHGDHGQSSLAELRFKAPPGTSYLYIIIHLIRTM